MLNNMEITDLKKLATDRETYRFFDLEFSIGSDSPRILSIFRNIFERFQFKGNGLGLSYYILNKASPSSLPALVADNRVYTVNQSRDLVGYAYLKIINSVLSKIKTHYLLHAASLSLDDKGIILPAASGSGKTTLAIELVKRGFHFLSDDITAVSKSDFILHPFPKSLGILPATLNLCPEADIDSLKSLPMIGGGEKKLLDIGKLYPGKLGSSCKLKYIVFLGSKPEGKEQVGAEKNIYVVVSEVSDELMHNLKKINGVKDLSIFSSDKYPVIKIMVSDNFIFNNVEHVCYRHQVLIFDISNGNETELDFSSVPRLERIPKSDASIDLLQRLKGINQSSLLKNTHKERISDILIGLGKLLCDVECYYLSPGNLEQSADSICALLENI